MLLKRLKASRLFSTSAPLITTDIRNDVFYCHLNHPASKNALSPQLISEIQISINSLHAYPNLRAVVFASAVPKVFCAGANLKVSLTGKAAND